MESGEAIPNTDHVARYVSPAKNTNKILHWSALLPRPQDKGEASYNWLEYFGSGTMEELVSRLRATLTALKTSRNGVFGAFNIGQAISGMKTAQPSVELRFVYTPLPKNDSHSSMFGVDELNEAAGKFLNDLCEKISVT